MQFSKQDRNTALTISIVLVVCTVSLLAVGFSLWQLIFPGLSAIAEVLGTRAKMTTVNYNFAVPAKGSVVNQAQSTSSSSSSASSSPNSNGQVLGTNYNFGVPVSSASSNHISRVDSIATDINTAGLNSTNQIKFRLLIPGLGIDSPASVGNDVELLLSKGFFIHPGSATDSNSQITVMCYRNYFLPTDPRSCHNLHQLYAGNEIVIDKFGEKVTYEVVGQGVFDRNDSSVYESGNEKYLKIVTADPASGENARLVILAKQK